MQKTLFQDKYPVFSLEIPKQETKLQSVDAIIVYLQELIQEHPIATFITVFDHYEHTKSIDGSEINAEILDAKNLIFCFGKQLPSTKILAVRPRSIGVSEMSDKFVIDFLEVPNSALQESVEQWVESIKQQ